jgi:hypothetical protein
MFPYINTEFTAGSCKHPAAGGACDAKLVTGTGQVEQVVRFSPHIFHLAPHRFELMPLPYNSIPFFAGSLRWYVLGLTLR